MKHIWIYALASAGLMLAACSQKEELPALSEGNFTYTINIDDAATKAVFSTDHMAWQAGDLIGWFTDKAGSSEVNMGNTPRSFAVNSTAALSAGSKIYAYAPYKAGDQSKTAAPLSIPVSQNGSNVQDAMPMVALPVTLGSAMAAATDTPIGTAKFVNLGALIRYNVYTTNASYAAEKVESVKFTSASNIAGDFTVDLTAVAEDAVPAPAGLNQKTVTSTLASATTVGATKDAGVKVYQVIAPGSYTGTITVVTDKAVYEYSINSTVSFERSLMKPVSLDLNAAGTRVDKIEYLLTAHQWELKSVKEAGVSVTTSTGNKLTLNADHTMAFDCSANGGKTFDHTWEGDLIDPTDYGPVESMGWSVSGSSLTVTNGFLLVFAQEDTSSSTYEIKELTDSKLTVDIEAYDETWTLIFEAVGVVSVEDLLTAHTWVLSGVKEAGVSVATSTGNKLTFNADNTMAFDCSANGGQTYDHTWVGGLITPNTYGEVEDMGWSVSGNTLTVTNGFLLVFAQEDTSSSTYEIKELTDSNLTVDIETYDETWTLLFTAAPI